MTNTCPCCGKPGAPQPFWVDIDGSAVHVGGQVITLTPSETRVIEAMSRRYPGAATLSSIVDWQWRDDPDGGPEYAEKLPSIYVCSIRKLLAGTPLSIESIRGGGYRLVHKELKGKQDEL